MALKSLYRVCEILKLDLIFSSFSVRSQNHSYKNSIVFRLARHLCSSTSLVVVVVVKVSDVLNVVVWVIEPLTVKSQRANTLSFAMFVTPR